MFFWQTFLVIMLPETDVCLRAAVGGGPKPVSIGISHGKKQAVKSSCGHASLTGALRQDDNPEWR